MATLGEANVGGRMVPAWLLNMTAEELDNLRTAVCRMNLLDNWYFAGGGSQQGGGQFPINQRGQTSYAGAVYGIDRWRCSNPNTLIEINSNGVKINNSLQGDDVFFVQKIENIGILHGKITLSVLSSASNAYARARIIVFYNDTVADISGGPTELSTITVDLDNYENITGFEFRIGNLSTYESGTNLIAAKLELGDHQTLAYQDEEGNWKLFETPDYAEELAKCKRYLQMINTRMLGVGFKEPGNGGVWMSFGFPVEMRVNPTVTVKMLPQFAYGDVTATGTVWTNQTSIDMSCSFALPEGNGITDYRACVAQNTGIVFELSAEL